MKYWLPLLLVVAGLLPGSTWADQKADLASVPPALHAKMVRNDPLSVNDIIALKQAKVSDGVITRYLRVHTTTYVLSREQMDDLRRAGVTPNVIDYMMQTSYPGPYVGGSGPTYYPPPPPGGRL